MGRRAGSRREHSLSKLGVVAHLLVAPAPTLLTRIQVIMSKAGGVFWQRAEREQVEHQGRKMRIAAHQAVIQQAMVPMKPTTT